ncbi:MAG: hypothetical protein FJ387_30885 [Verrucomicrobia bacterium]|nr:hypothetical protein [Verrucomicrobiota bacterium]
MAAKAEIGWKSRGPDGQRREVYAHHVGQRWLFYERSRRFEVWQPLPDPPLEDWLALLEAVERRVARRLLRPDEPARIRQAMRDRFPDLAP